METKQENKFLPLNEAITDFTEINGSHYNTRVPNFTLLPTKKFIKFDGVKIIVKLVSHYNMNGKFCNMRTYGEAICDPDNEYTKGFGIDLAFRKASEEMEKQCKQRLIAYSKDHMQNKNTSVTGWNKPLVTGQRNKGLMEIAKGLAACSIDKYRIAQVLKVQNKKCCIPPLSENELKNIINQLK